MNSGAAPDETHPHSAGCTADRCSRRSGCRSCPVRRELLVSLPRSSRWSRCPRTRAVPRTRQGAPRAGSPYRTPAKACRRPACPAGTPLVASCSCSSCHVTCACAMRPSDWSNARQPMSCLNTKIIANSKFIQFKEEPLTCLTKAVGLQLLRGFWNMP